MRWVFQKMVSKSPLTNLDGAERKIYYFAEGCRGHLGKQLIDKFALDSKVIHKHGIGFKEVWDVPEDVHSEGTVMHTFGWPSKSNAGSYCYHGENNRYIWVLLFRWTIRILTLVHLMNSNNGNIIRK